MKSEIIFTGTELLLGQTLNTNALHLQQALAALGIDLYFQVTVGDNKSRLKEAILQASKRADLVIIGGGLGPTEDDLSREALSEALGLPLAENPEALAITERFFKSREIDMSPNNLKQALALKGSRVLDNPVGTAPGLALEHNSILYILMPGPPNEFTTMLDSQIIPILKKRTGPRASVIKSRVLKLCGIGESKVDEMLGELLHGANPTIAPTAKFYEIHLRITSKAPNSEEAGLLNSQLERKVRERLGHFIYGADNETLPEAVGSILSSEGLTLAAAETCSGGYLSHLLTSFPGCADFFKLSAVSDTAGMERLFEAKIPASENPAPQLSRLIREKAGADIGLTISESPGGLYPAGKTVTIATSFKDKTLSREVQLIGEGVDLRRRAAQVCLVLLWQTLIKK
ncbi:MAG: CinA family nicotinamide mononucleotide deamidase-related protein [Bacillota bacterium]